MVRRFGPLSVGALLCLSLTTGCVTTGASAPQDQTKDPITQQAPPPANRLAVLPKVNEWSPQDITPPKPPPEPQETLVPVKAQPPEPLPLETVRITRLPAEDAPVLAALRCFLEKHPSEAAELLQKYDPRTQEELLTMLAVVAQLSKGGLENVPPQERARLLEQLDQLTAALRTRTPLSVEKICYCRHISGYGLYDPLPDDHTFAGGDRNHGELVQLYVEARNFANRQNGQFFDTSLASKLEIRDAKKELVVRMDFPAQPDRSLSSRQDYFIHYQFYVPAKMEAGDYTLTILLQDENATGDEGPRIAKRSLPFCVCNGMGRTARSANAAPR